jgi:hypothetical protein
MTLLVQITGMLVSGKYMYHVENSYMGTSRKVRCSLFTLVVRLGRVINLYNQAFQTVMWECKKSFSAKQSGKIFHASCL